MDLATGKGIGSLQARHHAQEFLAFLKKIDADVPANLDCHVLLDNASTKRPRGEALADKPSQIRLALHPDWAMLEYPDLFSSVTLDFLDDYQAGS